MAFFTARCDLNGDSPAGHVFLFLPWHALLMLLAFLFLSTHILLNSMTLLEISDGDAKSGGNF